MAKLTKKQKEAVAKFDKNKVYSLEEAVDVVTQTVRGACAILEARGKTPQEEIDKVTTPGGMTLKGLDAMERSGFTDAVVSGLKANSQ